MNNNKQTTCNVFMAKMQFISRFMEKSENFEIKLMKIILQTKLEV